MSSDESDLCLRVFTHVKTLSYCCKLMFDRFKIFCTLCRCKMQTVVVDFDKPVLSLWLPFWWIHFLSKMSPAWPKTSTPVILCDNTYYPNSHRIIIKLIFSCLTLSFYCTLYLFQCSTHIIYGYVLLNYPLVMETHMRL